MELFKSALESYIGKDDFVLLRLKDKSLRWPSGAIVTIAEVKDTDAGLFIKFGRHSSTLTDKLVEQEATQKKNRGVLLRLWKDGKMLPQITVNDTLSITAITEVPRKIMKGYVAANDSANDEGRVASSVVLSSQYPPKFEPGELADLNQNLLSAPVSFTYRRSEDGVEIQEKGVLLESDAIKSFVKIQVGYTKVSLSRKFGVVGAQGQIIALEYDDSSRKSFDFSDPLNRIFQTKGGFVVSGMDPDKKNPRLFKKGNVQIRILDIKTTSLSDIDASPLDFFLDDASIKVNDKTNNTLCSGNRIFF